MLESYPPEPVGPCLFSVFFSSPQNQVEPWTAEGLGFVAHPCGKTPVCCGFLWWSHSFSPAPQAIGQRNCPSLDHWSLSIYTEHIYIYMSIKQLTVDIEKMSPSPFFWYIMCIYIFRCIQYPSIISISILIQATLLLPLLPLSNCLGRGHLGHCGVAPHQPHWLSGHRGDVPWSWVYRV